MGNDLFFGHDLSVPKYDDSFDRFTPFVVGNPDNTALKYLRQCHDVGFHLRAIHIKAATDDHVFLAVDNVHIAVRVHITQVASMVPAVSPDFCRGFWHVVVAGGYERATGDNFTTIARRYDVP